MSALLAVTTCLPALSALVTTVLARSVPPITSTTISTAASSRISLTSVTILQPSGTAKSRWRLASRTQILLIFASTPS